MSSAMEHQQPEKRWDSHTPIHAKGRQKRAAQVPSDNILYHLCVFLFPLQERESINAIDKK